jgi:hypothetical protein
VTIKEMIARKKDPPKIGDYVVVRDVDGVSHLLIVTHRQMGVVAREGGREHVIDFMCYCGKTLKVDDLEVVPDITCVPCIQWKVPR